ncbi:hypothetical protein A8F70_31180 [Burkholderia cenocepacia]|nr:hypothetical protein A8F70_31180 [Burkholderia cenocepacia]
MKKTHFLVLILGAFLLGVVLSSHNGNARSTLDNRNGMNPSLRDCFIKAVRCAEECSSKSGSNRV